MTQTVARDTRTRPPMPPPKGVSVADNLPVAWALGLKWSPDRGYGYYQLGPDLYRVALAPGGDARQQTWVVRKLQLDGSLAPAYLVTLPTPGSDFPASCTCRGFEFSKAAPRACRHTNATAAALELIDAPHDDADDAVDRFEAEMRAAECGVSYSGDRL